METGCVSKWWTKRPAAKPYYIAPNGKTEAEAFAAIRDAMQDEERVALARIVMAHREHVIMLEPLGKGLLGTTLRFDYEVRSEKEYFFTYPVAAHQQGHGQSRTSRPRKSRSTLARFRSRRAAPASRIALARFGRGGLRRVRPVLAHRFARWEGR